MQSGMFGDNEDGYVSKTIALVNCCPPFRYGHGPAAAASADTSLFKAVV